MWYQSTKLKFDVVWYEEVSTSSTSTPEVFDSTKVSSFSKTSIEAVSSFSKTSIEAVSSFSKTSIEAVSSFSKTSIEAVSSLFIISDSANSVSISSNLRFSFSLTVLSSPESSTPSWNSSAKACSGTLETTIALDKAVNVAFFNNWFLPLISIIFPHLKYHSKDNPIFNHLPLNMFIISLT